jgi:hypothetical protein
MGVMIAAGRTSGYANNLIAVWGIDGGTGTALEDVGLADFVRPAFDMGDLNSCDLLRDLGI